MDKTMKNFNEKMGVAMSVFVAVYGFGLLMGWW